MGFLIFNPITLNALIILPLFLISVSKPVQGLIVLEVYPNSLGEKIGLKPGNTIFEAGYTRREWVGNVNTIVETKRVRVLYISDFSQIFEAINPGDSLELHTKGRLTSTTIEEKKPLGIKVRDVNGTEGVL